MPIYINSSADAAEQVNGSMPITMDSFTSSFVGDTTPVPDVDGSINRALDKFTASFRQTSVLDNWPFVYITLAEGNADLRQTTDPWMTTIAYSNAHMSQSQGYNNSSARLANWNIFTDLRAINPTLIICQHVNYHGITFDVDPEANTTFRWRETLLFADSANFDDWTLRDGSGNYYTRNITVQGSRGGLAFNWNCTDDIRTQVCQRTLDDFTDFDNTGNGNCMRDFNFYLFQDTSPEYEPTANYYRPAFQEGVTKISNTEYDVPTWAGAPTTGSPDGTGYFNLTTNHEAVFVKANRTNGSSKGVTGFKNTGGKSRIRVEGAPGFTVSNGDQMCMYSKTKAGNTAYGRSGLGGMTKEERWDGHKLFFNKYRDLTFAQHGTRVGAVHNGAANEYNSKNSGNAPTAPDGWEGFWEFKHFEHFASTMGFSTDQTNTFYALKPYDNFPSTSYNPDKLMRALGLGQLGVIANADSASGYPGMWMDINMRNPGRAFDPSTADQTDAAHVRFYNVLAWCMENIYPQIEYFNTRSQEDHSHPIMCDEYVISAGYPITARNFGTYDPDGNGGLGTHAWDAADFGTYGYIKEFDNCCIVINLRVPDNTSVPWIPSWVSGGQSITVGTDRATLPSAGSGKKWQRFNRSTYTNPDFTSKFSGMKATDFDATAQILKDTTHNDGSDAGATIDIGALESIVLLRVDA